MQFHFCNFRVPVLEGLFLLNKEAQIHPFHQVNAVPYRMQGELSISDLPCSMVWSSEQPVPQRSSADYASSS